MSDDREFEFSVLNEEPNTFDEWAPKKRKQQEPSIVKKQETKKELPKTQEKKKKITQPKKKKEKKTKIYETKKPESKVKKTNVVAEEPWPRPLARRLDRKGKVIANIEKQLERN